MYSATRCPAAPAARWRHQRLALLGALLALALTLGACGPLAAEPAGNRKLTVGMGYIANIQFAPFYVAQARGYYRQAGLDVEFQYGQSSDLLAQVASGRLPVAVAAGDEVLLARSQGLPVRMAFLIYQSFPVVVFSRAGAGITRPADLVGRRVGIPGRFGATYVGLKALLYASELQEAQLEIQDIGFNQLAAVSQGQVDAALGYAMNEPLVLAQQGQPVNSLRVADYLRLVSNGLVVGDQLLAQEHATLAAFVQATERGLRETLDDPEAAFRDSLQFIPELKSGDQALQREVLLASLPYWQSEVTKQYGLGYNDPRAWEETYRFLRASGLLAKELDLYQAYTNELIRAP